MSQWLLSQWLSPSYLDHFGLLPRAAADRHPARGSAVSPLGGFAQALRNPRAKGSLRVGEDHPSIQSTSSRPLTAVAPGNRDSRTRPDVGLGSAPSASCATCAI